MFVFPREMCMLLDYMQNNDGNKMEWITDPDIKNILSGGYITPPIVSYHNKKKKPLPKSITWPRTRDGSGWSSVHLPLMDSDERSGLEHDIKNKDEDGFLDWLTCLFRRGRLQEKNQGCLVKRGRWNIIPFVR